MTSPVNGLLTTYGSLSQVELNYYFTVSSYPGAALAPTTNYLFIGKVDQWPDDLNPPVATEDQLAIKKTFKNMVAAKLILPSNLSAVVPRFDWTTGTVYTPYTDYTDIFNFDANGIMTTKFYVRNNIDQVFKCLSNNNGASSTVQPMLTAGQTNPGHVLILADGYKWIYVTTIDKGAKQKFFDDTWMPITIGVNTPNTLTTAGFGSIDAINVTNAGNNYVSGSNVTTTITITGDGTGATAYANVSGNSISEIYVVNPGNNYTYATVSISPSSGFTGNGATANAVISPIGGHGYDPVSELGCNHIMLSMEYDGSENGVVPTDITFRQLGIIVNPILNSANVPSNSIYPLYDTTTVSFGTANFVTGETIYQGTSANSATFTATCCSFDAGNNILSLINTTGTYAVGSTINGVTSGASRVLLNYQPTSFNLGSGYMMYYENRQPVQRTVNDNQQIRLVLKF